MTPFEMEDQLKNLDERTTTLEQILPLVATREDLRDLRRELLATLATKEDLKGFPTKEDPKGFATKEDLKGFATKEDLSAGLEDARRYTLLLIQATRGEIAQVRREMATKADLGELRDDMTSMSNDVRGVAEQVAIMSTEMSGLSRQLSALSGAHPRKKRR